MAALPTRAATFVDRSVCGRRWQLRPIDEAAALHISQRLDLPEIVGRVLAARGVGADAAATFLRPRIRDSLPDPSHLLYLDVAVERRQVAHAADLLEETVTHEDVRVLDDVDPAERITA